MSIKNKFRTASLVVLLIQLNHPWVDFIFLILRLVVDLSSFTLRDTALHKCGMN